MKRLFFLLSVAALSLTVARAATFTVNSTGDAGDATPGNGICETAAGNGVCTLRAAIQEANTSIGVADTINFNIPGAGVQTITPLTALPTVTDPVVIDGYMQPGSSANTMAVGNNSVHLIELNGNGANFAGLTIAAGNTTVNGLVINRFNGNGPANGITIQSKGGNTITGCFIGVDATGAMGGSFVVSRQGIQVDSANNTIGNPSAAGRNVIVSQGLAIYMTIASNAVGNTVQGNYIGTNAAGTAALSASGGGVLQSGVTIETPNNVIGGTAAGAGNVIAAGGQNGINLRENAATGNTIQGNFIGVSADGTVALGGGGIGIQLIRAPSNVIGGTTAAARNVIAGDSGGITIADAAGNIIQGNYIGLNAAGTAGLPASQFPGNGGSAGFGVSLSGVTNTLVGGTTAGARNIISNSLQGLQISNSPAGNNLVQGNYIGTNAAGTAAIPNSAGGVVIFTTSGPPSSNNIIGGTVPGAGNVISGNSAQGISIAGAFSSNNTIQGNFIGVAADGVTALGNKNSGIEISANVTGNNNVIGGTTAGAGNVIAYNGQSNSLDAGVRIVSGTGNSILGNSIYSNLRIGINLANNDNVTPNDPCDPDTGPNNLQNFPVITGVSFANNSANIIGTLNSTANTTFRVEFFGNPGPDPSGYGQGRTFLGFANVTTDGSCNASFNVTFPVIANVGSVSATATDPAGNTSEFSNAFSSRLLNISTRMRVLTGEQVLIGGFIITGMDDKKVIIRGIGPSLSNFGIAGPLQDPTLSVQQGSFPVATNDDWKIRDSDRTSQQAEIEASGLAPTNEVESATIQTLSPGAYTAILRGKNNGIGVGVIEVYDLSQTAGSRLANISSRGFVDTGENVMIGGFIIGPSTTGPVKVVVRAIGPTLSSSGIQGALQDPTLALHDGNGARFAFNDNWKMAEDGSSQQAVIEATGLAPKDDRESTTVQTLLPGAYTAIVRGKDNSTGVAVVEVYALN